ncbi:MAG: DNA-binding response regulator, partial [Anaerolineae bacterium]|nr:DNA-binding response regulator [Anaerolineae bacterium]
NCKTLKEIKTFTNVPVIVLSVNCDPEFIASVLNNGADDFVGKPISYPILVARIKTLLRRVRVYSPLTIT